MLREARKVFYLYLVKRCSRIYEHFTFLLNNCLGIDSVFLCREHGVVGDMRDTWPNARVRKNHSLIHTYHGFKGDKQGALEFFKLILRALCLCWDRQTQDLHVDWILFRGRSLIPALCEVVNDNIDGHYPSSHYPIFAEFMLPRSVRLHEPPPAQEENPVASFAWNCYFIHTSHSKRGKKELSSMARGSLALKLGVSFTSSSLLLLLLAYHSCSFYLPGVAPQDFSTGAELKVKVNKLTSTKTQLPYSYYSLPYCPPEHIVDSAENLGEVLRGDRIENSPYVFQMREPLQCKVLCRITLNAKTAKEFKEKIDDDYRVNMILDNLPLVVPFRRSDQENAVVYQHGFHVGLKGQYAGSEDLKHFIHNHLTFTVKFHKDSQLDLARIVGFEVKPFSVKHQYDGEWKNENMRLTTCDPHARRAVTSSDSPQLIEDKKDVIFTYDVAFEESDVKWASRWDTYLLMADDQIHWFSVVNSLMIVLFLSGMVAMIMLRTLYRDISKYNQLQTQEEAQEETGWKLVHGDVFRPPTNSDLLCVYVGTGVQFFGMILVTMIFAALGFLSPSNRGGLMTAMLFLWVFMGLFAGYASACLYKMFKGTQWEKITLKTAFMFPSIVFAIFFVLNALIWGEKSSGAVPFGTMFALVFLWFGISVPLVFTGVLPFGAVFIELFFILTSIWLHQFYYIFGFLFIVFIILIVTCAEITIVLCYFQLCSEDYLWWWRSYLTSGSSALYLFLYAAFYFFTKLDITKPVSGVLYFGYMLIASYAFFVLTGTIGFYACFWFTRLIYSSVKID
ncbi:transmembrane 9 superfamily member 10-like [Populus alba x Populus x berolinensis]|uniref:Transmembrane 9 superfamily member n=1 Tax=Populus alba x Populus x berolinensis TaxID=444605 RepID=A0AAD6W0F3_9ROSI|nr:transmembrane 9 superfamily member 10-like [Populus alba x Populus x berolinensis]